MNYYSYMVVGGPIDVFNGCMSAKELIQTIEPGSFIEGIPNNDEEFRSYAENELHNIQKIEQFVSRVINKEYGESPHKIKFFALPLLNEITTDICCIAKIGNNGTTFIFTNNLEFARCLGSDEIYQVKEKIEISLSKV
ncbi:MAG: hypothetical protein FWE44_04355 [Defluviitaleaceae bacterium]|nr:hypothetical protein [Defluviitaleaceae bacterium]